MTDLMDLLDSAAGRPAAPTSQTVGDDVRRGRRVLLHRRWGRGGALVVAGVAVVVAAAVVPGLASSPRPQRVVAGPAADGVTAAGGVDLVPFDAGPNPKPISPALVPAGWSSVLDTENGSALVIAQPGSTLNPDDFRGKLVVYLDSGVPGESLPHSVEVRVGDRTGYAIRSDASALQIWVPQPDGTALRAQAPLSLHWDEATLGRFLGAVTVGPGAQAGVG
jgi:hypothetical protein